jgi:asparagine synthase (glutamine-hydrolysing)
MTALAGYLSFGAESAASACAKMLEAQAIYGRETRSRAMGHMAIGRRLWPTTPEDAFDEGPLIGGGGRFLLCADARIDNRDELAAILSFPERFGRVSDAAVVLAAYEKWGNEAFERLYGAFAVIVWDAERQLVTMARDAMGERPLHYHLGQGFIAVASMPKGLHALPTIPYAARLASMADFLTLMPETGSDSFFEGIERVTPGHVTEIDKHGAIRSWMHWQPALDEIRLPHASDYVDVTRATFDESVSCRMRRLSGSIGSHLSAGLDSSGVTATAARLNELEKLYAFTSVATDGHSNSGRYLANEEPLATATALRYPNIDHVHVATSGVSPLAGMDRHFQLFQRPILNPCNAVWNDAINDAAQARGVTVMLTGQMGNMTISHSGMQQLNLLARKGAIPALFVLMTKLHRRGHSWQSLAAQAFGPFMPTEVWTWLARKFNRSLNLSEYSALHAAAFDALDVGERSKERALDLSYRPWANSQTMRFWALRRVDFGVYNKGTLAGWGIDQRDPTSDRRLIELTLRIPERHFILNGECRSLARRAFADRLPAAVVAEQRRGMQASNWQLGVSNAHSAIAEEFDVLERNPQAREIIDLAGLRQAHAKWPDADPNTDATANLYRHAMLRALAAGHFLRKVGRTN